VINPPVAVAGLTVDDIRGMKQLRRVARRMIPGRS
jgi:hypothetical protein